MELGLFESAYESSGPRAFGELACSGRPAHCRAASLLVNYANTQAIRSAGRFYCCCRHMGTVQTSNDSCMKDADSVTQLEVEALESRTREIEGQRKGALVRLMS